MISIVIPVFNGEKYIAELLNSIQAQTFEDFEVIIINDGSRDGTEEKCLAYANSNKKIKLFTQENAGVSSARNKGIIHAKGEYIVFVDADDTVEPTFLQVLHSLALENNADCVCCGFNRVYDNKKSTAENFGSDFVLTEKKECIKGLIFGKINWSARKIFCRSAISDITFDEKIKHNEDKLFLFKVFNNINKIVYSTQPLYNYIRRDNSITTSVSVPAIIRRNRDTIEVASKILSDIKSGDDGSLVPIAEAHLFETAMRAIRFCKAYGIKDNAEIKQLLKKYYNKGKNISKKCKVEYFACRYLPQIYQHYLNRKYGDKTTC